MQTERVKLGRTVSGPSAHRHERSPEDPGVAHLTATTAQANDLGGR
jgi:hypothetical protein